MLSFYIQTSDGLYHVRNCDASDSAKSNMPIKRKEKRSASPRTPGSCGKSAWPRARVRSMTSGRRYKAAVRSSGRGSKCRRAGLSEALLAAELPVHLSIGFQRSSRLRCVVGSRPQELVLELAGWGLDFSRPTAGFLSRIRFRIRSLWRLPFLISSLCSL